MLLKSRFLSFVAILALSGVLSAVAADAPKVSTFAPAKDLEQQADKYLKAMKDTVASEQDYKDAEGKIGRDSNTLVVIVLALGLHDEDNKYKAAAPAIMKAAQDVAATKDYAGAKKAVEALDEVVAKNAKADGELKWAPVAALPELMKQVPMINTKLKLTMKGKNFTKKAKDSQGHTAVIATIAQATIADTSMTKNAEQVKQWQKFSNAARDDAAAVNAAIHKADQKAADAAMTKLNQSCEDCHAVFKPDVAANPSGK